MPNVKYTAVDIDASKALAARIKPKRVTIPKLSMQVIIEADAKVIKNPTWIQRLQMRAKQKADEALDELAGHIRLVDMQAGLSEAKSAVLSRRLSTTIETTMKACADAMAKEAVTIFDDYKRGQADLRNFRIVSAGKIAVAAIGIATAAATTAVTGGALSPLGIYGAIKGVVGISQEIAKLALSADQIATVVQAELKALKLVMNENVAKASTGRQVAQVLTEGVAGAASKALGLEIPSLKNCDGHIKAHKAAIAKLDEQSRKLSESIYPAMDLQAAWQKNFDSVKGVVGNANKVRRIEDQLKKVEAALDTLLKSTIKVNEGVDRANKRQASFEDALNGMQKGLPGWLKYVDTAIGFTLDVGGAIADSATPIEKVLNGLLAAESAAVNEFIDAQAP